jgi:hypothetical protein
MFPVENAQKKNFSNFLLTNGDWSQMIDYGFPAPPTLGLGKFFVTTATRTMKSIGPIIGSAHDHKLSYFFVTAKAPMSFLPLSKNVFAFRKNASFCLLFKLHTLRKCRTIFLYSVSDVSSANTGKHSMN